VPDWAFGMLKLPRLISVILPENHRLIRVAEKIGECSIRDDEIDGVPVRIYAIGNPTRS
jgi:RimJ/RimL family protein N-acetyltransferase